MLTDRQLRSFELALVCVIAFAASILTSIHALLYGYSSQSSSSGGYYQWTISALHEIPALGLVWYVLQRRGKTFADLGLIWRAGDFWRSVILRLTGSLAFFAVYYVIYHIGFSNVSHSAASARVGQVLYGAGISIATFLFQFLNPFFEELIVRAYVMTEIKWLTNNTAKAVIISTLLQTSYHFYQGAPMALAHGATFLIWSIYYARTGRIAPIILAHLYSDVGYTLKYLLMH